MKTAIFLFTLFSFNLCIGQNAEYKFVHPKTGITVLCDSIEANGSFTVCYIDKTIVVYNSRKKLKLPDLKAIKPDRYFPKAQIIQRNKLREINIRGTDYKKGDGPAYIDLSYQFPDQYVQLKITEEDTVFYLNTSDLQDVSEQLFFNENSFQGPKYKLYHTQEIEAVEYTSDNFIRIVIGSESGYSKNYPFLAYTKLKNGKYNLNTIDYLLSEKPNLKIESLNQVLPKNVDTIKKIDADIYLIEKDGLFTYYPIVKEIKYRKLEDFQGNFARFELPDGQKGWLDLQGNEYLDN